MRIKKAVLLVLNNKTKGSVLSTNAVHANLNPSKIKGAILSDNEQVQNYPKIFSDIVSSSDSITKVLFYNRSFITDKFDEIDIVYVTLTKSVQDDSRKTDTVTIAQGKNFLEAFINQDQSKKTILKVFKDVDAHIDKFTVSLSKKIQDTSSISEILSKILSKTLSDITAKNDFVVLTNTKNFSDTGSSSDTNTLTFTKSIVEINSHIEKIVFDAAKTLSDNFNVVESFSKEVSIPKQDQYFIADTSALDTNKSASDLVEFAEFTLKEISKGIVDLSVALENVAFAAEKILSNDLTNLDTPQKTLEKSTSDFFSTADTLIASLLKERSFADFVSSQDFNILSFTKGLEDFGITTENVAFDFSKQASDDFSVIEQLSNYVTKVLGTDDATSIDEAQKDFGKSSSDEILSSENSVREIGKLLQDNEFYLEKIIKEIGIVLPNNAVVTAETILNSFSKVLSDSSLISDIKELATNKVFSENSQSLDNIIVNIVITVILSDIANNISKTVFDFSKTPTNEFVQFSETIDRLLIVNRFPKEVDYQDYTEDDTYFLSDYIRSGFSVAHPDYIAKFINKGNAETATWDDAISLIIGSIREFADVALKFDSTSLESVKALEEFSSSFEQLSKNLSLVLANELNSLVDDLSLQIEKQLSDDTYSQDTILVVVGLAELLIDSITQVSNTVLSFNKGVVDTIRQFETVVKDLQTNLSETTQLLDLINILLITGRVANDVAETSTSGTLLFQNYIDDMYFSEDYVGESRILT